MWSIFDEVDERSHTTINATCSHHIDSTRFVFRAHRIFIRRRAIFTVKQSPIIQFVAFVPTNCDATEYCILESCVSEWVVQTSLYIRVANIDHLTSPLLFAYEFFLLFRLSRILLCEETRSTWSGGLNYMVEWFLVPVGSLLVSADSFSLCHPSAFIIWMLVSKRVISFSFTLAFSASFSCNHTISHSSQLTYCVMTNNNRSNERM